MPHLDWVWHDVGMNIFVLCTGRCGSVTFSRACSHITNYTAGHETRSMLIGPARLAYPDRHIEVDNRLSWMLGRLERSYGNAAYYVHLTRDREKVVMSKSRRRGVNSMSSAYFNGVMMGANGAAFEDVCRDQVETMLANIDAFLRDKSRKMGVAIETGAEDFARFWEWIGAQGNLAAAMQEFSICYNASVPSLP